MRHAPLFFLLLSAFTASPAWADDATSAEEAPAEDPRALFQEGQTAYNAGRYDTALARWQRAYELSGRSALLYNIAQAHSRLGRVPEEKAALEAFIAADDANQELKLTAEERLSSLEERIARTFIRVESELSGAEVFVDGVSVGTLPLPEGVRVSPGTHRITADAEGYVDAVASVAVPAGETVTVELHFEPIVVESGRSISPLAWGLWAGGGAVLATGAVLGGLALGKSDGAYEGTSAASSARGMALGADIGIAVGAAAVVTGVIVQIVHKKKRSKREGAPELSLSPTFGGATAFLRHEF